MDRLGRRVPPPSSSRPRAARASRSSTSARRGRRRRGRRRLGGLQARREVAAQGHERPPDKDGWTNQRDYDYQTSPNEKRDVGVGTSRANDVWTVAIYDMAQAVGEKRGAQVALIFGRLLPKGYARESFAGKKAQHARRGAHRRARARSSRRAMQGDRRAGRRARSRRRTARSSSPAASACASSAAPRRSTRDTLFMIASNTKALTTLMLAKLVDEGKMTWETPVTSAAAVVQARRRRHHRASVLVKHLICACTGLPRQDFEWLFQFKGVTPEGALADARHDAADEQVRRDVPVLEPAGRRGRVRRRARRCIPQLELGAAYDEAMQTQVFDPLGMTSTTFDYAKALAGQSRDAARARRRRQAGARGDGAELLDHPAAAGRRRAGATSATC